MMNIEQGYKDSITKIFEGKRPVIDSILTETKRIEYSSSSGAINLLISKPYAITLLKSKIADLKDLLEINTQTPIKRIYINGTEIELNLVRKVDLNTKTNQQNILDQQQAEKEQVRKELTQEIFDFGQRKKVDEELTTEKTIEKTIQDAIFTQRALDEFDIEIKDNYLDFYNKHLGNVVSVEFDKTLLSYRSDFKIAGIFFFTLIIPIVFITFGLSKKAKLVKTIKKVKHLVLKNYRPLNDEAKKFVVNFIVKKEYNNDKIKM